MHFLDKVLLSLHSQIFVGNLLKVSQILLINFIMDAKLAQSLHLIELHQSLLQQVGLINVSRTYRQRLLRIESLLRIDVERRLL